MPTPVNPSNPKPSVGDAKVAAGSPAPIDPSLDERLHGFWRKNGQAILWFCALVLLGYVGKAGWEYLAGQREAGVQQEFASATTPDKLKAFAAAHPGHKLTGVAELQLADAAYAEGRSADAIAAYERASAALKTGLLAARAQLGLAMAKIQGGQAADGEASLRRLSEDLHQYQAVRTEATYQLASLAASAGRADEVKRLSLQLMQIDPSSPWTQRAFILQSSLPAAASAAPAAPPGKSAILFKPGTAEPAPVTPPKSGP